MYTSVVALLAIALCAGEMGGAPTGVTPTAETPPTKPPSRDFSSGSYVLPEDSSLERGISHDREILCTDPDCADIAKSSSETHRARQVSHIYLYKGGSLTREVQPKDASDAAQRVTDWLLGQDHVNQTPSSQSTTSSGLFTWSWLDGTGGNPTPESVGESKDDPVRHYPAYGAKQGENRLKNESTGSIADSWSLPIRYSPSENKNNETDEESKNSIELAAPSISPPPETTTAKTGSYAGHQWLTTKTVTKNDTHLPVTNVPKSTPPKLEELLPQAPSVTKPPPAGALTARPVRPFFMNPSRHTAYTHSNSRRSTTTFYTNTPLPTTSLFTDTPLSTTSILTDMPLNNTSTSTDIPISTTSIPTYMPLNNTSTSTDIPISTTSIITDKPLSTTLQTTHFTPAFDKHPTLQSTSSTTNRPQLTTRPRTYTPRFTAYPRTRKPPPPASTQTQTARPKITKNTDPIFPTQPTSNAPLLLHKSQENDTNTKENNMPKQPSTIEELTFMLSNKYINTDSMPTSTLKTEADFESSYVNVKQSESEKVKEEPVLGASAPDQKVVNQTNNSQHPLVTFSYVFGDSTEDTTKNPLNELSPVHEQSMKTTYQLSQTAGPSTPEQTLNTSERPNIFTDHTPKITEHPNMFTTLLSDTMLKLTASLSTDNEQPLILFGILNDATNKNETSSSSEQAMIEQTSITTEHSFTALGQANITSKVILKVTEQPTVNFDQPPTESHLFKETERPSVSSDNIATNTEETSTDIESPILWTHPMNRFTAPESVSTPGQPSTPTSTGGTSTSLYYSHGILGQDNVNSDHELPSNIDQIPEILGQLFSSTEKPTIGPVKSFGDTVATTDATEFTTPAQDQLITFTGSVIEITPTDIQETFTHQSPTIAEQAKFSPWTTLPTTIVTSNSALLAALLNQTLTLLSNKNPNTKYSTSNLTDTTSQPTVTPQPYITTTQRASDPAIYYNEGSLLRPVMNPQSDIYGVMASLTTTTAPHVNILDHIPSCEEVSKLMPLLDFYGTLYPGLVNPCKTLRVEKENEKIGTQIPEMKPVREPERQSQSWPYVSDHNIQSNINWPFGPHEPFATTPASEILANASLGYSTYRVPKPVIVSNSYSAHAFHIPSSPAPSASPSNADQNFPIQQDALTHNYSQNVFEPAPTSTERSSTVNDVVTSVSTKVHPYSVYFPERNVSYHINGYPQTITVDESDPPPSASLLLTPENTSSTVNYEDDSQVSSSPPSYTLDENPQLAASLDFDEFDAKPTATLVSEDGSSIIVSSMSLNSEYPLLESHEDEEETKWVKISVDPSTVVAPTTPSISTTTKRIQTTTTTTTKPTTENSNSLTSIWGAFYNRWATSGSPFVAKPPVFTADVSTPNKAYKLDSIPEITSDFPQTTPSVIKNFTTSFLMESAETFSPTNSTTSSGPRLSTNLLADSQAITMAEEMPFEISDARTTTEKLDDISSIMPTSTLFATSQTTPVSDKLTTLSKLTSTSPSSAIVTLHSESITKSSTPTNLEKFSVITSPTILLPAASPTLRLDDESFLLENKKRPSSTTNTTEPTTPLSPENAIELTTQSSSKSVAETTTQSSPGSVVELTTLPVGNTSKATPTTQEPATTSKNKTSPTQGTSSTTSTPLTRVLGSLWDLFRGQPSKTTVPPNGVPADDSKNESSIRQNVSSEKQKVTTTEIPLYTIYNLTTSIAPNSTSVAEVTDNSTGYMQDTTYEEKHRYLQVSSKYKETQGNPLDTVNITRDPTKSPLASYLPSSIESLDNLFSLLGKFGGKNTIFGLGDQSNGDQYQGNVQGGYWPSNMKQHPTEHPHYPQLITPARGPGTVTYRPPSARHRYEADAGKSTQRPAIILKKQGSRVQVPLIPSADFNSFIPLSSPPPQRSSNSFRPHDEAALTRGVPPRALGTLPANFIRSRLGEGDYTQSNNGRNEAIKAQLAHRERHRPHLRPTPMGINPLQRKRCGNLLRDRLDHLLGRELVMDQFGVRVYSSVVERWESVQM